MIDDHISEGVIARMAVQSVPTRAGRLSVAPARSKMWKIATAAIVIIALMAIATVWFLRKHNVTGASRARWIVASVAFSLIVAFSATMILRPKSASLAWVTDIVALVLVGCLVGLVPVLFLSPSSEVHLLKLAIVIMASLAPGLLYFQFLRARGPALWQDFVATLKRLDIHDYGPLDESEDVPTVYHMKFEATYGRFPTGQPRGKTLFPVLCLTALLSVGWAATLTPEGFTHWQLFGGSALNLPGSIDFVALRFGFVGFNVFVAQMLVRRYFQNDLKADAYITCLLRLIVSTFLIAVIFSAIPTWRAPDTIAIAFVIGLFPQIGIDIIKTKLLQPWRSRLKGLEAGYSLSLLDGMNVWYEARLLEEGVEDLQNLKTASWIDLILQMRIPPGRIVDWVDQAILIVHLVPPPGDDDGRLDRLDLLRQYGVATATDLEAAVYGRIEDMPSLDEPKLDRLLNLHRDGSKKWMDDGLPAALPTVLRALALEPNLGNVRSWKHQMTPPITIQTKPAESGGGTGADQAAEVISEALAVL